MSTCVCSLLCLYDLFIIYPNGQGHKKKTPDPKANVGSSLRVFVQHLLNSFTMFFNVHMRMFCFNFYMTIFLNCVQSGVQGHRKKVAQNAS